MKIIIYPIYFHVVNILFIVLKIGLVIDPIIALDHWVSDRTDELLVALTHMTRSIIKKYKIFIFVLKYFKIISQINIIP